MCHRNKMSPSLHATFNVVFSNVYFVTLIFNIHERKLRFSEGSQSSISEKLIFGHFEVIFRNVPGRACFFLLEISKRYFDDNMSSLAREKKVIQFSAKVPILAIFDYQGLHLKSIFSTYGKNFEKSLEYLLG